MIWEYMTLLLPSASIKPVEHSRLLNGMGLEGWEMVNAALTGESWRIWFKRPKKEDAGPYR